MGVTIYFLIISYSLVAGVLMAVIMVGFNLQEDCGLSFLNPNVLYKTGKVNWFGAYFLGILFNLIFTPCAVFYWIYKLCTVGRR